ncbi:MAG: ISL3 family transposase [Chloroflexi bacterium]|uniref:ISL3 family transposase n=1 Tax=Candidatus Flexifilum breve TaxID=3140694 RepID=UPI0031355E03|nr:ISL3 family transposase [Chloroflexota bacterium]
MKQVAELARQLQMTVSGDTVLRILRQTTVKPLSNPKVVGIDDWAFAKGRRYGTILVDLERGVPVDLLPDRTTATLAAWLQAHPGIEVITRDRFSDYALAVNQVCPTVQQVADRWHLLKNLRETLERVLRRLHERLRSLPPSTELLTVTNSSRSRRLRPPSANEQATTDASRLRRYQLYQMVHYLLARGLSQRKIASLLNLHRITVRLYTEAKTFPERIPTQPRASILDAHLTYLQQRWQADCTNASQLYREIQVRGYKGSYQQVARWAHVQRQLKSSTKEAAPLPVISTFALPAARHLAWLFVRLPDKLSTHDKVLLTHVCQDPACRQVYDLAQQFHTMLCSHSPDFLDEWLKTCTHSQFPDLREFALGLLHDLDAVRNAFSSPWSNGPVEGHICRLKLLKRQMYGRAKLDLLRIGVLARSLPLGPT